MKDSDASSNGLPSSDGEPPYSWIDEWLCEYVDGTMDPSMEAVFEQYVEANPELKAHIKRLRKTRDLLSRIGTSSSPGDALPSPPPSAPEVPSESTPSTTASLASKKGLGLVSSVTVALAVGFLAGTLFVGTPGTGTAPSATASDRPAASPPSQSAQTSPVAPSELRRGVRSSAVSLFETDSLGGPSSSNPRRGP